MNGQAEPTLDLPNQSDHYVNLVTNTERRRHALLIPGYIRVGDKTVGVKSLIDTGADAVIINTRLVDQYKLPTVRLPRALTFRNADDSINKKGMITHRIEGHLQIKHLELPTRW